MALDKFLLRTQPLARALETAWAQMAVVAKEQAGANPEAAVPKVTAVVAYEKACANLEVAVPKETAVGVNEKAGANPEADVPKEKDGVARTHPEEAHAGLGEKTFGERGTLVAGAAAVRQGGVVASRIAGSIADGGIKSDSENGSKKPILKLPLPEEKRRQQEATTQCLQTGESGEAGTEKVEGWSTEEATNWPGRPPGPAHGGDKGVVGGTRVDGNSNGGVGGARSTAGGAPRAAAARDVARVPRQGTGAVAGRTFDDSAQQARRAGGREARRGVGSGGRSRAESTRISAGRAPASPRVCTLEGGGRGPETVTGAAVHLSEAPNGE